jgi:hypothetical protein
LPPLACAVQQKVFVALGLHCGVSAACFASARALCIAPLALLLPSTSQSALAGRRLSS